MIELTVSGARTETPMRPGGLDLTARGVVLGDLREGARVLDLGCGFGHSVDYMRDHHGLKAVGSDRSPSFLSRARKAYPGIPLVSSTAEELPFRAGSINAIVCECVLSLVDLPLVLRECRRVLRDQGVLIVNDLYNRSPVRGADGASGILNRAEIEEEFSRNLFRITHFEDWSAALKEYAVQLILDQGSLDDACCTMAESGILSIERIRRVGKNLGYCLLIAGATN